MAGACRLSWVTLVRLDQCRVRAQFTGQDTAVEGRPACLPPLLRNEVYPGEYRRFLMSSPIRLFGSAGPTTFTIERGDSAQRFAMRRELWFDQDVDGRWLICATRVTEHDGQQTPGTIGSLVVTDARVGDFIETLARLLANPDHFSDEPQFHSPH